MEGQTLKFLEPTKNVLNSPRIFFSFYNLYEKARIRLLYIPSLNIYIFKHDLDSVDTIESCNSDDKMRYW